MLTYELALLVKQLPKSELTGVLKRTASAIFDKGGIIRSINNIGPHDLPYKTSRHGSVHRKAHYFVFEFTAPPSQIDILRSDYNKDIDLIRNRIYKANTEVTEECTIEEEMKPPPYRSEVIKMIEQAKKQESKKPKFKYNTGLDYYPFQK